MANQDSYTVLESVIRQTFASVVWTHKIQEKQGDIEADRYHWMEVANIVCASLTSAGIIGSIFSDGKALKIITALISFVTIFCGAYPLIKLEVRYANNIEKGTGRLPSVV